MKHFLLLTLFLTSLFAFGEDIQSFEADFVQEITDETGKVIRYEGHIQAKRPAFVLWDYKKPEAIAKKIFINSVRVVIVQPALEQAAVKQLRDEISFFEILASVVAIGEHRYKARYKNINFILEEESGIISSLAYTDELENKVHLSFSKQRQNRPIEDKVFTPRVPPEYDIIRE